MAAGGFPRIAGLSGATIWWLLAVSAATFAVTLIAVVILLIRIPPDYYASAHPPAKRWAQAHPVVRGVLRAGTNLLGVALMLAGVAMLVLPGQGLLAILAGIMLVEFPGKRRLERSIVARGPVLRSVNWLRHRAGRRPLVMKRDRSTKT